MVIFPDARAGRLTIHVDPARPEVWRQEPYAGDLAVWARVAEQMHMAMAVEVGGQLTMLTPGDGPFGR